MTIGQIKAINTYRPKIEVGQRAETGDLMDFIARSMGLDETGVRQMLLDL